MSRCDQPLYAHRGAEAVMCEACGATYTVAERKQAMLAELADTLMTTGEIARLAATFTELPFERVRNLLGVWQHRGRIVPVTHLRGKPAYAFGPTLAAVLESTQQAA